MNSIEIPEAFAGLFEPHRYKVFHGGRGSGKSWSIARALVHLAHHKPLRIVCAREFQNSIEESVHKLLSNQIAMYGLPFTVDKYRIYNDIGSEFIFKGLAKQDASAIKSLEGADIVWVEEAQSVSEASWRNLTPTVRKDGSEIWVSFNPDTEDAPTYQRFVIKPPTNALVVKVNWDGNPWFPKVLEQERVDMLRLDPSAYDNVWEGNPRTFSEGAIFREEMAAMAEQGRIGKVPYNPSKPVIAIFDMGHAASGKGDPHAITFVQPGNGTAVNAIDYWEGNNKPLPSVIQDELMGRGYAISKVVMPHDANRTNAHTGKTDIEIVEGFGFTVEKLERTPDLDKDMNNLRTVLPLMYVDEVKCKALLACLRNHKREKDEKTGLWRFKHDWTSHGVSSARYMSVYYNMNGGIGGFANDNYKESYGNAGALSL